GSMRCPRWPGRAPGSASPSATAWFAAATASRMARRRNGLSPTRPRAEPPGGRKRPLYLWKIPTTSRLRGAVQAGGRRPLEHLSDQVGVGLAPGAADGHVDPVGVEPA